MGKCTDAVHYSAILRRNASTSSKMFKEKNFGNSVDDGVRDNGGMCCKAFLGENNTETALSIQALKKLCCFSMRCVSYCVL